LITVLVFIVGCYLVICAAAFLLQRQLIYHPFLTIVATPQDYGLEYHQLRLQSDAGVEFDIWQIPAGTSRISVVHFHGNADNISTNLDTYKTLHELGINVYAVEYRGYGKSTGKPSEKGITADVAVFAAYLRSVLDTNSSVVIAMGRSLGGAVAVKFARVYPVRGLILESTFSCMSDVASQAFPFLPVSVILREQYNSEAIVRELQVPVLVFHSREDEVVPFQTGEKLFSAVPGPKRFVEIHGSHNSGYQTSEEILRQSYAEFFEQFQPTKKAPID
jgi:hypothetical protein